MKNAKLINTLEVLVQLTSTITLTVVQTAIKLIEISDAYDQSKKEGPSPAIPEAPSKDEFVELHPLLSTKNKM